MKRKRVTDPVSGKVKRDFKTLAKFIEYMAQKYRQSEDWREWYTVADRAAEEQYAEDLGQHAAAILGTADLYRAKGFRYADLVYRDMIYSQVAPAEFQPVITFLAYIEEKKTISPDWLDWPTGKTLKFDESQGTVILDDNEDKPIQLTPYLGTIMSLIYQANGDIVSTETIGLALYGDSWFEGKMESSTVDKHVGRLRDVLGQSSPNKGYIRTQRGEGWYLFFENDQEWKQAEALAKPVETMLRTEHYDPQTCTGFHFAVKVYNTLAESPLTVY